MKSIIVDQVIPNDYSPEDKSFNITKGRLKAIVAKEVVRASHAFIDNYVEATIKSLVQLNYSDESIDEIMSKIQNNISNS